MRGNNSAVHNVCWSRGTSAGHKSLAWVSVASKNASHVAPHTRAVGRCHGVLMGSSTPRTVTTRWPSMRSSCTAMLSRTVKFLNDRTAEANDRRPSVQSPHSSQCSMTLFGA